MQPAVEEKPIINAMLEFTYVDSTVLSDMLNPTPNDARYMKGNSILYSKPLSMDTINAVDKWLNDVPTGSTATYLIMDLWGGSASALKGQKDSAFPHRDTLIGFEFVVEWGDAAVGLANNCPDCITWINSCFVCLFVSNI
jgi:hypothetical protein